VEKNLTDYINGFSPNAREIIDRYEFHTQIGRLNTSKRTWVRADLWGGQPI
jgi:type I restriction enzyme M protein